MLRTDEYHQMAIDSIIFDYKLYQKSVKYAETNINKHQKVIIQQNKPIVFGGYKLPTNMDITTWSGNVKFFSDYTKAIVASVDGCFYVSLRNSLTTKSGKSNIKISYCST